MGPPAESAAKDDAPKFDAATALHETPRTFEGAVGLYDDWAFSYDETLLGWGYEAHIKIAELLKKYTATSASGDAVKNNLKAFSPVMDCGCGTGLSGEALALQGFWGNDCRIVGTDCSEQSLRLLFKKTVENGNTPDISIKYINPDAAVVDKAAIPLASADFSKQDFQKTDAKSKAKLGSNVNDVVPSNTTPTCLYSSVALCNLEHPWTYPDNTFGSLICVGVTSYVTNFKVLFGEWVRIVRCGGIIVWTHRSNIWDTDDNQAKTVVKELEDQGKWKLLYRSEPSPYMPKNTVEEERIKTIYYNVYEVMEGTPKSRL